MTIRVFFIFYLLFVAVKTNACDVCGCSSSGTNLGILPQFYKNFIGVHYYQRSFLTRHQPAGLIPPESSRELFRTKELRGRFHIHKRIQLFILLPYHVNQQINEGIKTRLSGIGDITSFANYSVYNTSNTSKNKWKHNVQLGGGLKLPTGNYNRLDDKKTLNPYLQPGTGSLDFLITGIHTMRYNNFGINTNLFYRMNNANANDFRFGNRVTVSSSAFYWVKSKENSLLPNIGLHFEGAGNDSHGSFIVPGSNGSILFTTLGTDLYYKNITVGMNAFLPTYGKTHFVDHKPRFAASLLYNFKKRKAPKN